MDNAEILSLIEKLTDKAKRDARRLSAKLEAGEIDNDEWQAAMLALLVSAHIIAASVGRGGVGRMTPDAWGKVKQRVEWQGSYLERFGRAIVAGTIIAAAIGRRAASYVAPAYVSYQEAKRDAAVETNGTEKPILARLVQNSREGCQECTEDAAAGWMPVEDMEPIGSRACGIWCLCDVEFSDSGERDLTDYDPQFEMR